MSSAALNALYFIAGVFCTLMGLYMWGERPKKVSYPKRWTALEVMEWHFDFDYDYEEARTAKEFGKAMCYAMLNKVNTDPVGNVTIDPGHYSIHFVAKGVLTKRES